jgi:DGQHR domain-containing protein
MAFTKWHHGILDPVKLTEVNQIAAGNLQPNGRILELFRKLCPIVLSARDVKDLLSDSRRIDNIETVLQTLVQSGDLECDKNTGRIQDSEITTVYRFVSTPPLPKNKIEFFAEEIQRPSTGRKHYFFDISDARVVTQLAKLDRLDVFGGQGQQREAVKGHIANISEALAAGADLPNPILLSFSNSQDIRVSQTRIPSRVRVEIFYREDAFDVDKPLVLIDGQQRIAAAQTTNRAVRNDIPVTVNLILEPTGDFQELFLASNNTQKISCDVTQSIIALSSRRGTTERDGIIATAVRELATMERFGTAQNILRNTIKLTGGKYPTANIAQKTISDVVTMVYISFSNRNPNAEEIQSGTNLATFINKRFAVVKTAWPNEWNKPTRITAASPIRYYLSRGVAMHAIGKIIAGGITRGINDQDFQRRITLLRDRPVAWSDAPNGSAAARTFFTNSVAILENTARDKATLATLIEAIAFP